jgi:5-methylcytosine-specific restriction endonuclease McrA
MTGARSDEALDYRWLYDTAAWKRLRLWKLRKDPLCKHCLEQGLITEANVVNHRIPHKGDLAALLRSVQPGQRVQAAPRQLDPVVRADRHRARLR